MNALRLLPAVIVVLMVGVFAWILLGPERVSDDPMVGQRVPSVTLEALDGIQPGLVHALVRAVGVVRVGHERHGAVRVVVHGHLRDQVHGQFGDAQVVQRRIGQPLPAAHDLPAEEADHARGQRR